MELAQLGIVFAPGLPEFCLQALDQVPTSESWYSRDCVNRQMWSVQRTADEEVAGRRDGDIGSIVVVLVVQWLSWVVQLWYWVLK